MTNSHFQKVNHRSKFYQWSHLPLKTVKIFGKFCPYKGAHMATYRGVCKSQNGDVFRKSPSFPSLYLRPLPYFPQPPFGNQIWQAGKSPCRWSLKWENCPQMGEFSSKPCLIARGHSHWLEIPIHIPFISNEYSMDFP